MRKKEIWLLGMLISVVITIEGWSLIKVHFKQTPGRSPFVPVAADLETVPFEFQENLREGMSLSSGTGTVSFGEKGRLSEVTVPDLELELLGTAIGNIKDPIAFIKDLKTGRQGMFRLGNLIRDSKIVKISMGEVVFENNGHQSVLRLGNRGRAWCRLEQEQTKPIVSTSGDRIIVSKSALLNEVPKLRKTISGVKVKPHYQSDEIIGLMIEGVAPGSLIEAAGIHNRDVIKAVNNQKINSYQKALQVFRKVRNQKEIKVSLLRDGEDKFLSYRIEN